MDARQVEAASKPVEVEFRGEVFTIEPVEEWGVMAVHWWERGKMTRVIEEALGQAQYEQMIASRPTLGELTEFLYMILGKWGIDPKDLPQP
jgi:hypothetical protein